MPEKLDENGLTARAVNALLNEGIKYEPEAVSRMTRKQLLAVPNCGEITIDRIEIWLSRHGLRLGDGAAGMTCPYCGQPMKAR